MKNTSHWLTALLLLAAIVPGCGKSMPETLTKDYDPVKMDAAIKKGQETFGEFAARYKNPQPGDDHFAVKVKIQDPNGVEHFWLTEPKLESEPYSGKIGNDPGIVKNVKFGQTYTFNKDDISDWMYIANGVMQGNYTLKVELESMPPDEAAKLKKMVGW